MSDLREEIIDPDRVICDPHHHLWDHPTSRYLLEDLLADTGSGHRVVTTVFVECSSKYRPDGPVAFRPVGETEFVAAVAQASDGSAGSGAVIAGIVGFADLTAPEIEDVLAAHVEAAGGRFRGIRHASAFDPSDDIPASHTNPPPDLLAQPSFRSGIAALGRAGLTFDAWLFHPQLGELADLARSQPEVTIILDHLGGPLGIGPYAGHEAEVLEQWRHAMADVATCQNVVLKLGGIGMPFYALGWREEGTAPTSEDMASIWGDEIRWCIEQFGAERCMFESNFPVDKQGCSYDVLWNAFKRMVADASPAEKAALFHDTATRIYQLNR